MACALAWPIELSILCVVRFTLWQYFDGTECLHHCIVFQLIQEHSYIVTIFHNRSTDIFKDLTQDLTGRGDKIINP